MALTMTIDFAANVARLVEETRKGSAAVRRMADDVDTAGRFIKGALGGIAAGLSVGLFVNQARAASEAADAAAKMSDRFGIATERAIGMNVAIAMAGGTQETMGKALRQTTVAVGDAVAKGGEMADAFKRLGLSAQELSRMPVDQQFQKIIERLGETENVTERNYLGNRLLGKSYSEVAGLVAEGGDAIRQATEDAKAWGLAVTRVDAAKIEAANDAVTRMQNAAKGLFTTISITLAPAVKLLADYFADSAAEADGYKQEVVQGSEFVAQALAYSLNGVHALKMGWSGIKLAVGLVMDFVIDAVAGMDRVYTDFMNRFADSWVGQKLGMEKRQYSDFLTEMSDISKNRVEELRQEAFALVEAGWPAEKILEKYRQVQAQMQAEAESTAAARAAMGGGEGGIGNSAEDQKAADEAAKRELAWQQGVAQRLAKIQESNMSEAELERGKLIQIQNDLQFALDNRFITEQQYHELLEQEQLKHEAKLGNVMAQGVLARQKISQQSWVQQAGTAVSWMKNITNASATSSKEMFEINKAAAITEVGINTYRAAQGAYAALAPIPYVGPFLGAAAAALAIGVGLANAQAISSAQYGSSTSAPSIAGGGAIPVTSADPGGASAFPTASGPVPEFERKKTEFNFSFVGSSISMDQMVNEFIPKMEEAYNNGAGGGAVFNVSRA